MKEENRIKFLKARELLLKNDIIRENKHLKLQRNCLAILLLIFVVLVAIL
jgi:hypothetical protein